MAAAQQAIWIVLLAGSILLCELLARARVARLDPLATVATSGIAGVACLSIAALYMSAGW
jgi:hypothetical protein